MAKEQTGTARLKAFDLKKNTMLIALIALIAGVWVLTSIGASDSGGFSLFESPFIQPTNISNVISQNAYVVALAVGMLLCILTGGNIDLSVGSGVALIAAVAGKLMVHGHVNVYLSIVICLLLGIGLGAFQAYFIAYLNMPPFITTLGGMLMFRGIAYVILNGTSISPFPPEFCNIFSGNILKSADAGTRTSVTLIIGGIAVAALIFVLISGRVKKVTKGYPVQPLYAMLIKLVLISAVIIAVFALFSQGFGIPTVLVTLAIMVFFYYWYTSKSIPGRYLYAIGGNKQAALFSGVNTKKMMFFAYTNMGFCVAVAALICAARFQSSTATLGDMYELDAIGSCFVGGASAYGGSGTIGGSVIGAAFFGVLNNGMQLLHIDQNWQKVVKGVVLLIAVLMDVLSHSNRAGKHKAKKAKAETVTA